MEPSLLIRWSFWLLFATAVVALAMAWARFAGRTNPPSWLAMVHWFLASAAVALLAYASLAMEVPRLANWALVLLFASAAGGVVIRLGYELKEVPVLLCTVHTLLGIAGFLLLMDVAFWS